MRILEALSGLVGDIPAGYDIVVWALGCLVLLFLLKSTFGILASVLNWVGGKR